MESKSEFWRAIEPLVREIGLEIFDIESAGGNSGFLRVFIARPVHSEDIGQQDAAGGVSISDCARISKGILALAEIERYLPGDTKLEVSSPGINRKLRRADHFAGAVGERVRVGYFDDSETKKVSVGVLLGFEKELLTVEDEQVGQTVSIPLGKVRDARVDFQF